MRLPAPHLEPGCRASQPNHRLTSIRSARTSGTATPENQLVEERCSPSLPFMTSDVDKSAIVQPGPILVGATVHPPTVAHRSYFSTHLFAAAQNAASAAVQYEEDRVALDRFSLEHRGYVISAIVLAVAFMEAAINEIFKDAYEGRITEKLDQVEPAARRGWSALWLALDEKLGGSTLGRYQAALVVAEREVFDRGREPWQSAQLLTKVRNALVHFEPETLSQKNPQDLVAGLKGHVTQNPFSKNTWELDGWLSASCATWAVESAEALVQAFAGRTGARPNYTLALEGLRAKNP